MKSEWEGSVVSTVDGWWSVDVDDCRAAVSCPFCAASAWVNKEVEEDVEVGMRGLEDGCASLWSSGAMVRSTATGVAAALSQACFSFPVPCSSLTGVVGAAFSGSVGEPDMDCSSIGNYFKRKSEGCRGVEGGGVCEWLSRELYLRGDGDMEVFFSQIRRFRRILDECTNDWTRQGRPGRWN